MAGLSGGQRKLLIFELIYQRTATQENLLIVLDEPFAGVTDDFVPYIMDRLKLMRITHNILLVTNDHVDTLKNLADNTITVSAVDRSLVKVNGREGIDRELTLLAMSIGDEYSPTTNNQDMKFFRDVEFSRHGGLQYSLVFAICAFGLFVATYWNSQPGSEALVITASGLISFFCLFGQSVQLVDWRVFMLEETEALLHSSKSMNKFLKFSVFLFLTFIISSIQYLCINTVTGTLSSWEYYVAIVVDTFTVMLPGVLIEMYTSLTDEECQMLSSLPPLLGIFFSTTLSPGAGIDGLKALRYIFPRFYLWCMLPGGVSEAMEGCPADDKTLMYLIISSMLVPYLFGLFAVAREIHNALKRGKKESSRRSSMHSAEFVKLQLELFGEIALGNLQHYESRDMEKLVASDTTV